MKDIMRVIKSLENRGILIKGATKKIVKKENFLTFLGHYCQLFYH